MMSSCAVHSHLFLLGLVLAYYMTHFHIQALGVRCKPADFLSSYPHCRHHPDGVWGLDCFGSHTKRGFKTCLWRPGNHTLEKRYTLIIKQPGNRCTAYNNITGFSGTITVYKQYNMTAEVLENAESTNCTKAVFRGSPQSLLRCDPPYNVAFSRKCGKVDVNVSWKDAEAVKYYLLRYKTVDSLLWNKPLLSQNGQKCTVENLNSSLFYNVQIQCVSNEKCTQCPWSEMYTVPAELTTQPVIVELKDDIAGRNGKRLLSLNWKFSAKEPIDGYYVTIGKETGEIPCERMSTAHPEIRLILSYSSYLLNISAVNNASTSPAVSLRIPQREDNPRDWSLSSQHGAAESELSVTVNSNTSFTVYWKDDLIKTFVCYSAEWRTKGHEAVSMSFYQNKNNYRTLSPLPEPLQPYKRYTITLHTRPEKETCNIKRINNSESTYATTQFYFIEGSPISAPNISSFNVTLNSAVLKWSSIPEDDVRGLLLGYFIHYAEYVHHGTGRERNITVGPQFDTYELGDLKGGTAYQVQLSGFTQAGAGVRSTARIFKTYQGSFYYNLRGLIIILAFVATVPIFGSLFIKKAKAILWPSIPNPGKSNAMQRIEAPCEMELLASINTLRVEEWDTNSLQILEKEDVVPSSTFPLMLPLLRDSGNDGNSTEMTPDWTQRDTEQATEDIVSDDTAETPSNFRISPFPFPGDYTTMEMFQQAMPQGTTMNTATASALESESRDMTVLKANLDNVGNVDTSSIL